MQGGALAEFAEAVVSHTLLFVSTAVSFWGMLTSLVTAVISVSV